MTTLTYSSIQAFKACRRKYQFRYLRGLVPVERGPVYFSTGAAFHIGLERHYKGDGDPIAAAEAYFNANAPAQDDLDRVTKWDAERRLTLAMLSRYREQYQRESFQVHGIEIEFNLPIGADFCIAGKVDGIVREAGKLWIVEHKTAHQINNIYKRKLTLDAQSILYTDAASQLLNERVQGVIYNVSLKAIPHKPEVLKNGKLSRDKRQMTTPELFRQAIAETFQDEAEYADFLAYLEANRREYFFREYLTFSDEEREEWRQELADIALDIAGATQHGRFYRNTAQCTANNTVCAYFDICTAPDREAVIESSFRVIDKLHTELDSNNDEAKEVA